MSRKTLRRGMGSIAEHNEESFLEPEPARSASQAIASGVMIGVMLRNHMLPSHSKVIIGSKHICSIVQEALQDKLAPSQLHTASRTNPSS